MERYKISTDSTQRIFITTPDDNKELEFNNLDMAFKFLAYLLRGRNA